MDQPVSLDAFFGEGGTGEGETDGELELEIGFGRGRFLIERALANPTSRFLGLETRRKWVHLVAERAAKRQVQNIMVLHGDARLALAIINEESRLSRVFINFPDPWWKAKHEKRLVVEPETIGHVVRLLIDDGELMVQTDVDYRAQAYKKVLDGIPDLRPAFEDGYVSSNPFGARSLREVRCEETGLAIYRLLYKRIRR